jgi:small subunit ribosomal protein S6
MSLRRMYETTIIVNAALEDSDIDAVLNKVVGYIENHGGQILEINKWGRRRLAYPINKKYNGYYIHLVFDTAPSTIPILERFLVLEDTVLRHLTLILPKKLREYRAKRAIEEGVAYSAINPEAQKIKKDTAQGEKQEEIVAKAEVKAEVAEAN